MMPKRFITYSRTQPARTIVATVAIFTLFAGLFIFTPWFIPAATTPAVSVAFGWPVYLSALFNCICTIPALLGVKRNTTRALSLGAFWLFIWYLFVTLTRLITAGATLAWVPTLIIALVMATLYLEQAFQSRRNGE